MTDRLTKFNAEKGEYEFRERAKTQGEFAAQRKAAIQRLGELEDRIEQEKIVELPCQIGETVYHITTCEGFHHELDGSLYDSFGGVGDATGYYCPCELRDNCPFDNEEDFDCDTLKTKQAVFEDEVKGIMLGECQWDNVVFLGYSGNVYFNEFGKTVFLDRASAEAKVREMEGTNDEQR